MLRIRRRFELRVSLPDEYIIRQKLRELDISVTTKNRHETTIGDDILVSIWMICVGEENSVNRLVEYLSNDYKGFATITF